MAGKPSKSQYQEIEGILHKSCTRCQSFKPATRDWFSSHKQTTNGLHPWCRECHRLFAVAARESNPFQITLSKVKRRSLDTGIPFDLDKEYLKSIWTGTCPVFGFEIKIGETGTGHALPDSAALDRKIPMRGYVKGNVVWLSTKANLIKQNATPDEVISVGAWMKENIK